MVKAASLVIIANNPQYNHATVLYFQSFLLPSIASCEEGSDFSLVAQTREEIEKVKVHSI